MQMVGEVMELLIIRDRGGEEGGWMNGDHLGDNPRGGGFRYASSSVATASNTTTTTPTTGVVAPPTAASVSIYCGPNLNASTLPRFHPPKPEASSSSSSHRYPFAQPTDVDAMKARIISHPHYSNLLNAYMDCQKVGAPPEVADRLSAVARDFEARQRARIGCRDPPADPELDQFMEAYYHMLVKYREELTRPLQEATDFLRRVESQLSSLTNGSFRILPSDDKHGVCCSEDDQEGSGEETELPEIDPRAEDAELKRHLLKKYSGYLSSLRQELCKKKKKGKLPKEARQKLLGWWEMHYKWPYPSEAEKVALAESTGLDQKQINNWFINQRKRHWKPSEDMQFVVMDGFHPHSAAALYMDGHFMGDGLYRLGQ